MALKEYYQSLEEESPRSKFRKRIIHECGVARLTAYRWLSGEITPEKLKRDKIAEVSGLSVEELFPSLNTEDNETE